MEFIKEKKKKQNKTEEQNKSINQKQHNCFNVQTV